MAISGLFGGVGGGVLNLLNSIFQQRKLSGKKPSTPNITPGGGTVGQGSSTTGTGLNMFNAPGASGLGRGTRFAGTPSPQYVVEQALGDRALALQAGQKVQGRQVQAAEDYGSALRDRIGTSEQRAISGHMDALRQGGTEIAKARAAQAAARTEVESNKTAALAQTAERTSEAVEAVTQQVASYHASFQASLAEMKAVGADLMADARSRTAELLQGSSAAMQAQTRQVTADAEAEARAKGVPEAQISQMTNSMRMMGSDNLGNMIGQVGAQEAGRLDQLQVAAEVTPVANLYAQHTATYGALAGSAANTIAGALAAASAEDATTLRHASDMHRLIAGTEAEITRDANNWRSAESMNWAQTNAMIASEEMAGNLELANLWRTISEPFATTGDLFAGLLDMNVGLVTGQFNFDQASFQNEMALTGVNISAVNNFFSANQAMSQADKDRSAASGASENALIGAGITGASSIGAAYVG